MTLIALIQAHGYWLLAVGCLLEGETVLLLAGFAAHRGHLDPFAVVAIAAAAGFTGDEGFFWLGRRHGTAVLARWPAAARQVARVNNLIVRFQSAVIVFVRFAYGLRVAGPMIIGMSPISAWRFAAFNAMGALLWACVVGGAGWLFGQAAEVALGHIREVEGWLLLGLAAAAAAWGALRWFRSRR
jgi:membrane protein DedA with SNARE-associated domain